MTGSSEPTMDVIDEFRDRLRLRYHYQEDLGNRTPTARNAGARLASGSIIAFMDTGTLAGPDFVRAHREANAGASHAVIGYRVRLPSGRRPHARAGGGARRADPTEVVARFRHHQSFWDWLATPSSTVGMGPQPAGAAVAAVLVHEHLGAPGTISGRSAASTSCSPAGPARISSSATACSGGGFRSPASATAGPSSTAPPRRRSQRRRQSAQPPSVPRQVPGSGG